MAQPASQPTVATGDADRTEIDREFAERLRLLADKCDELNLPEQAKQTRRWIVARDPGRQYLYLPDDESPNVAARESRIVQQWAERFQLERDRHAERLFELAQSRAEAGDETAAFQRLHETLHHNPAHAAARAALGHRQLGGRWQTPGKRPVARPGRLAHPTFGWSPRRYWLTQSDHYVVSTNHSPQAGIELAEKLELLHSVWSQVFYRYWATPGALTARLKGEPERSTNVTAPLQVVLFADRDEYLRQLGVGESRIDVTIGYYSAENRRAYFYASDQPDIATWYHEATHQLFQEAPNVTPKVGERANFWIAEAIALYMESLTVRDGYATVGGFDANRLQFARYRRLNESFHMPLAELAKLGRAELQRHEDLRRLYSESAGLAHLLMDGQANRYRAATIDYLAAIYRGVDDEATLSRTLGVSPSDIDDQYAAFLNVTDRDFTYDIAPETWTNLALGHTQITDESLSVVGRAAELTWLDLTDTNVTDAGVSHLKSLTKLRQLTLEGTRISDRALQVAGELTSLEELDLSRTAITDAAMSQLGRLKNLKTLWLTGTSVTDTGLRPLADLPRLERVELTGTATTAAGREWLKQRRPNITFE
ncbi:MAG: hypothetical protein R3C99_27700 [Pirellulaceae bacterium]